MSESLQDTLPLGELFEERRIHVLLVADDPALMRGLREALALDATAGFRLERAERLAAGLQRLRQGGIDVIVLDLALEEGDDLAALDQVRAQAPAAAVLAVTRREHEALGVKALRRGALEYLVAEQLTADLIVRCVRDADRRRRSEAALRHSEAVYHSLAEGLPQSVCRKDAEGRFRYANQRFCTSLGRALDEVIGKTDLDLFPAEQAEKSRREDCRVMATGEPYEAVEARPAPDGGRYYVHTVKTRLHDPRGRVIGTQCISWDVTEQVRAEEALRASAAEFRLARQIQQGLYAQEAPALSGFDIAGAAYPVSATGGDYFDYLGLRGGGVGLVVGDASGHGVGPALLAASTRAYLRALAPEHAEAGEVLSRANRLLSADVPEDHFVTLLLACLDPATRRLTYASAGHATGYVLGPDGELKARLESTGLPLGVHPLVPIPAAAPRLLAPGDLVLLLTDGVVEARGAARERFGPQRTLDVVRTHQARPAKQIVVALDEAVRAFTRPGPPHDDITVLIAKAVP